MIEKNSIFNFLESLNLVDQSTWETYFSDFCDFEFSRNKANSTISVKVKIKKVLPPEILFFFINETKLADNSINFKFEFCYEKYDATDIINYLIYYVNKNILSKSNAIDYKQIILEILNYNLRINVPIFTEKEIIINYIDEHQLKIIKKYLDKFQKFLFKYGFINHQLVFSIDEKTLNNVLEHKKKVSQKISTYETNKNNIDNNDVIKNKNYFQYKIKNKIAGEISKISDLFFEMKVANIEGEIFNIDVINTKNGYEIHKFYVTDYSDSIIIKALFGKKGDNDLLTQLKIGSWVRAKISIQNDVYENNDITGLIEQISIIDKPKEFERFDQATEKRTELINHTNMTAFEGLVNIKDLFAFSDQMGYQSVAITDKFNCQNFPEFYNESKNYKNIKPIYGIQFDKIQKEITIVRNADSRQIADATYTLFDIETTGLSPRYDKIIEFGAVKYHKGNIIGRAQFFINPEETISDKIFSLTRILNADLQNAIKIKEALLKIKEFIGDSVLIAHNGIKFDLSFLNCKLEELKMDLIDNPLIDTLQVSRSINEQISGHSLGIIARKYKIEYNESEAHRADKDAEYLLEIWKKMLEIINFKEINTLNDLNIKLQNDLLKSRNYGSLITVYCKNQTEIKKLYQLISTSLTRNYFGGPKVYQEDLNEFKNSFLVTNSPTEGDILETALNSTNHDLEEKIKNEYDFITIAPPDCFLHEIARDVYQRSWIEDATKKIIKIAQKYNKKIIASSDTYYLNENDQIYFRVYVNAKTLGGKRNRLFKYNEVNSILPHLYFRTTTELKNEFAFLNDSALVDQIVVSNTNYIASLIDTNIKPIKETLHTPHIDGADEKLRNLIYQKSTEIFGSQINTVVKARIDKEINSIINNGYAMIYWFSHLLVNQSVKDGFFVGSRGSVGSSIAAWLVNITEVNPLEPHYLCSKCNYFNFVENVKSGFDLPSAKCPQCNNDLISDGHNIPFETFMGFKGDKIPDIDLNFSALYQGKAHEFIKEMFGKDRVFRAGTINTIAQKTAYGYVKTYFDENNISNVKNAEILRISKKCENVKRTTGQHPGGIVVIPHENDIYDFTPFNYPADDTTQDWYTTHLAFESLHDSLLKFDILGHDNPTILKMLTEQTKVKPESIPNFDKEVMDLFNSTNSLKIKNPIINKILKIGSTGIPEFGTNFVKEMLLITKPQKFSDLIRISGLSHGTNVWNDNAKYLIEEKDLKIADVISCRDDIMEYLIDKGIEPITAFKIMEDVRKGKGLNEQFKNILINNKIPSWYIDSCEKISYLFPKAHATAYVIMAWKIAWFKIHYPLHFYASYFSIRVEVFDIKTIMGGESELISKINEIKTKLANPKTKNLVKNRDIDLIPTYELALELIGRGFRFAAIDLEKSEATDFIVDGNQLIPPFSAINGLGETVASSIVKARQEKKFTSKEDIKKRTKITSTHLKDMNELGITSKLDDDDQISIFNFQN